MNLDDTTKEVDIVGGEAEDLPSALAEEDYPTGFLSALTDVNIQVLEQRVRKRLPVELRDRVTIATYDETLRFNVFIIDGRTQVVQPYFYGARGVESPTLLLRKHSSMTGMFATFERTFAWLWDRRSER